MDAPKTIDPRELITSGILQEANRRFFHPLGLALMVSYDEMETSGGTLSILDSRDDPEGFLFADLTTVDAADKRAAVDALAATFSTTRVIQLDPNPPDLSVGSFVIQPIGHAVVRQVICTSAEEVANFLRELAG